jgi:hypothetical protein
MSRFRSVCVSCLVLDSTPGVPVQRACSAVRTMSTAGYSSRFFGFGFSAKIPACDFRVSFSVAGAHLGRVIESPDQMLEFLLFSSCFARDFFVTHTKCLIKYV